MTSAGLTVRPAEGDAEVDALFGLATDDRIRRHWRQRIIARMRHSVAGAPGFRPEHLRGAWLGDELVGRYVAAERMMRVGAARVPVLCLGAMLVHPDHREGGAVDAALLADAEAYAQEHGLGLVLLRIAPSHAAPFGFPTVAAVSHQVVPREVLSAWTPEPDRMRPARLDEAELLNELRERHYGGYTGYIERSLDLQRHRLSQRLPDQAPMLSVADDGRVTGYVFSPVWGRDRGADDVVAEDWTAALTLLHAHDHRFATFGGPAEITWSVPPDSATARALAGQVPARAETLDDMAWTARPGDPGVLFDALLPAWQARWAAAGAGWAGTLTFDVDGSRHGLAVTPEAVAATGEAGAVVALSAEALAKAVFGYRELLEAPAELQPVVSALFPAGAAWVAGAEVF